MPATPDARLEVVDLPEGGRAARLSGDWTLKALLKAPPGLPRQLGSLAGADVAWDCRQVETMDSAGALLLWRTWGHALPPRLAVTGEQQRILDRIATAEKAPPAAPPRRSLLGPLLAAGRFGLALASHVADFVVLVGRLALDVAHLVRWPGDVPWKEFSANIHQSGVRAMPVTALVGFLVGVVLSYLSALQLRQFGADIYIVNLLGLGIVRELGPVLVAVLVAGRSGSAMTAQLGVMRVTEEIDALAVMGVPRSLRLVFPKVAALAVTMPMLVLWASAIALVGAMLVASVQLDLSPGYFLSALPRVVLPANLSIALAKGIVFGILVAAVACHFGLRVKPNTESLSTNTTASVVTAITVVIFVDALFAVATKEFGMIR